jgi:hypothetical protein
MKNRIELATNLDAESYSAGSIKHRDLQQLSHKMRQLL